MTRDELAPKRRYLTELMLTHYAAKAQAWRDNPAMDINLSDFERTMNRAEIERTLRKAPEELLDQLKARYDRTAAPQYVY